MILYESIGPVLQTRPSKMTHSSHEGETEPEGHTHKTRLSAGKVTSKGGY